MTLQIPLEPIGPWRDLSPDMPAPITVRLVWPTATHYFEANRQWFDRDRQTAIAAVTTPTEARRLGSVLGPFDWDGDRQGTIDEPHMYWRGTWPNVIRRAIHERTVSDPAFVGTLVETSDEDLVLDTDEPWIGRPQQGWARALMEMRARLALVDLPTLRTWWLPPWLQHPEIPNGSIGWRMGYGESYLEDQYAWLASLDQREAARWIEVYPGWPNDTYQPGVGETPIGQLLAVRWAPGDPPARPDS